MPLADERFDRKAAVTRSLLGWGVVAGVSYLVIGVVQGLARDGFSFGEHPLSLLMLGSGGWLQSANLIVSGCMVIAAGVGVTRAMSPGTGDRTAGGLIGVYGMAMIASGFFPPDPMNGFPEPGSVAELTMSGVIHMALGGIAFLALSGAAIVVGGWLAHRGEPTAALRSRTSGGVVLAGFLGGAALSSTSVGVILLWIAVLTGWAWLAATSITLYRRVPHPDLDRRGATTP